MAISNRKGRLLILTLLFAYIVITIVTNCLKTVFVGVTHFIVFCLLVALALYLLIYKQYYKFIINKLVNYISGVISGYSDNNSRRTDSIK